MKLFLSILGKSFALLYQQKALLPLLLSICLTTLVAYGFFMGLDFLFTRLNVSDSAFIAALNDRTNNQIAPTLANMLFPSFIPLISSFTFPQLAQLIVKQSYSELSKDTINLDLKISIQQGVWASLFLLSCNLLLLPLYMIPIANLLVYFPLNAYFLVRVLWNQIARAYPTTSPHLLRQQHLLLLLCLQWVMLILSSIPFLSLLVPFLATSIIIHAFYQLHLK